VTAEWLGEEEKYALIGLKVKTENVVSFCELELCLWTWTGQRLDVPAHWREGLGSVRTDQSRIAIPFSKQIADADAGLKPSTRAVTGGPSQDRSTRNHL
jgi:hypothetical protein